MDIYSSVTQKQVLKSQKATKNGNNDKNNKNGKDKKKNSKKIVHDLFVQGTNDSSIVSKRSVEILYNSKVSEDEKQYFQYFVKKSPRRTPVINRGYWIRMKSIRMAIEKIIAQQPKEQRINIINLGCGYDPLPFQLLDDPKLKDTKLYCIDVDFPELIGYKSQMIKMAPELLSLIGPMISDSENSNVSGIDIRTNNYATMGCDLTDKELYCKQLDSFMANNSSTTNIFIAEVSLAYMTPETANPIIQTSSTFSNSHFLILEQLMPAGENHPFAKRMLNHFKKMEAPLQCVETYPTIPHQINRFIDLGFKYVNARDLLGCWNLVPDDIKLKVGEVEAFDEWEEFIFFGQHYINLHATNQPNVDVYPGGYEVFYDDLKQSSNDYSFNTKMSLPIEMQRKFHTCLSLLDLAFITCGTNQSRLADTVPILSAPGKKYEITTPETLKPRIGATGVTLGSDGYLIGGRRMPGVGIDDLWKLERLGDSFSWKQLKSLDHGRVKHTSVSLNNGGILVYGGSSNEGFAYYSKDADEWRDLSYTTESYVLSGLSSAKLVSLESNGDLYLFGGMIYNETGKFEFNPNIYKVDVCLSSNTVTIRNIFHHRALARYGFDVVSTASKVLLIGGVGRKLYDQNDTIIELIFGENSVTSICGVRIDNKAWECSPVFVGSDLVHRKDKIFVVGGGAVCYGFGSVWGDIFEIGFEKAPEEYKAN